MVTGWELDNKNYMITNNGKIAAKVTNTISTLFSQGPQFDENHIIEFKVTIYNVILFTFFSSYVTFFLRFNLSIIVFRSFTRRRR